MNPATLTVPARLVLVATTAALVLSGLQAGGAIAANPTTKAKTTTKVKPTAKARKTPATTKPSLTPSAWKLLAISSRGLTEVSGCAFSRQTSNRVWLHNDAGDGAVVVPVNVANGRVGQAVTLEGVDVVDPEDIASTTTGDLLLADIGDNAEVRGAVQLYRFREPTVGATTVVATRLELRYPDAPHNAEAFAVSPDGATGVIIAKATNGVAAVFRVDLAATGPQVVSRLGTITIIGETGYKANMISAADAIEGAVLLRTFQHGYLLNIPVGATIADAWRSEPRRFAVPQMPQGEALCASPDGRSLVTASESQGAPSFSLAVGPSPL